MIRVCRAAARAVALLASALFGIAVAQETDPAPLAAALPESNEAAILTSQVEQAIQHGDYRLAINLTRRIAELPEGLVAVPGGRTYYPIWRQALRLLSQLPPEAVELYRQMYDAQVRAELEEAAPRGDIAALRRLFRTHRASAQWEAVGAELAAQLLDRGAFGEAIDVLRVLSEGAAVRSADIAAQLAVALCGSGATTAAEEVLARLSAELRARPQPGWDERLTMLRTWVAERDNAIRGGAHDLHPLSSADANWALPLTPVVGGLYDDDDQIAESIDALRRLPLLEPVIEDDAIFLRARGTLWSIDALTLTLRWRVGDMRPAGSDAQAAGRGEARGDVEGPPLSADAGLLFSHALRHAVSAGFGKVFTVEGLALFDDEDDRLGWQGSGDGAGTVPNALVARSAATGQVAWRAGVDADDPLFGVAFQDAPMAVGGALCVPIQRDNELRLCLIDPETGKLRQETMIAGPPTTFSALGGRCLLTGDETTAYVCTGNGVVAALGRDDLSWKWAAVYPAMRPERRGRWRWMPPSRARTHSLGAQRPLIAENLLIVCPPDAPYVFAFDRFNGRQAWPPLERSAFDFVVGSVVGGLLVAGNNVTCLDLSDGRSVRWRSVTMEIAGRPCIAAGRVYVPTSTGLVTLDANSGRVLADAAPELSESVRRAPTAAGVGAVLLADSRALYGITPNVVFKQPDVAASTRQVDALLAGGGTDARGRLADAWLKLLSGRADAALDGLKRVDRSDAQISAACDRLLAGVFLALARTSPDAGTRLDWLKRAATLSPAPGGAAAGLMLYVGRTLEESGQVQAAVGHYLDMLAAASAEMAVDGTDSRLRRAGWALALERVDALLARYADAAADAVAQRIAAAEAGRDWRLLRRLRGASALPGLQRQQIDAALTTSDLPYELAVRHAEAVGVSERGSADARRLLERWAAHVALAEHGLAQQDQAEWSRRFEAGALSEADRAVLTRVQRDTEKLAREQAPVLGANLVRSWRLPACELMAPLGAAGGERGFFLARSVSEDVRQVRLVSATTGQVWRSWPDGLPAADGSLSAPSRDYLDQRAAAGFWQGGWPVAQFDGVAAVPVVGGLLGVGLGAIGPEKRAGAKLWEFALPEWGEVPADFENVSAVGPDGVCVLTPRRRLMLLDWHDGNPVWERDLGLMDVVRIARAGGTLLLLDRDEQLTAVGWRDGHYAGRFPVENLAVQDVAVVDSVVIALCDVGAVAFDAATRETIWTHAARPDASPVVDEAGACVALRERAGGAYTLLDAHTGRPLLDRPLPDVGQVTALARSGDRLYLAGIGAAPGAGALRASVQVSCVEMPSGLRAWSAAFETQSPVTRAALSAGDAYIPILIERASGDGSPEARLASLAIQLVERQTGRAIDPISIADSFRHAEGGGPTCMLVTPSRIIVQCNGTVAAFGTPRGSREP